MSVSAKSPTHSPNSLPARDLVLRLGFAGKRQRDATQTYTVASRLRDVFSVIG